MRKLGFADLADCDLVTADECAARLGYGSASAMRRALKRKRAPLPRAFLRGRWRAADLKDWFLSLRDARADGAFTQGPTIVSLDAARLRRKLAAL